MKINSILINNIDNVVTVTVDIKKDENINFLKDGVGITIIAKEVIPVWNKVAINSISKEDHVIKYGEIIGAAIEDISEGSYVSHLNIMSLPRNYDKEMRKGE